MSHVVSGDLAKLQSAPREVVRWQKAQQQLLSGRFSHALSVYNSLARSYPQVAQLWFELGMSAAGDLDFSLAHKAFQACVGLSREDAPMLVLIGEQYQRLRQLEHAKECYEKAVKADPNSAHARLTLAAWFERERNLNVASSEVEICLAKNPGDASAVYYRAFLQHRKGENEGASQALRDLLKSNPRDPNVRASAWHLLALIEDALENYGEAMRCLFEAKKLLRARPEVVQMEKAYDRTSQQRTTLMRSISTATLQRWQSENGTQPCQHKLVFLGGHPRTGTTLIEQVLGTHPEVIAFDEPEAFMQEVLNDVAPAQSVLGLTLDGLNGLSAARRLLLRERYFKSLFREVEGEVKSQVLIDKNPSPTFSLPLWLRVFPGLKIIMPFRDPRDVIISCFFQNLALTNGSVNFLSLERTVRHFTELMDVWFRMKELGQFDWLETRYETLVEDLEGEGRRLTEFIGLPWDDAQAHFHESARRKFVFAPTYHDVTKPVHKRAIRRWEHYAETLAPFADRLDLYCSKMGYR